MMSIETAFLLGVLFGQSLMLQGIWRALVKLVKVLSIMEANANALDKYSRMLTNALPEDVSDLDQK